MKCLLSSFPVLVILSLINQLIFVNSTYNTTDILKTKERIAIDFLFDKEYSHEQTNQQGSFNNYFFTYEETELALVNGARMKCYHPNKIQLNEEDNDTNKTKIINVSLDWGYIFFREINSLCYNNNIDKWFYKICPSKMAVQILSQSKIDEKTGQEVKEVNYLGFSMNYTNLSSAEDLFAKEMGVTLDKFLNDYSPRSLLVNLTQDFIVPNGKIIKMHNAQFNRSEPKKRYSVEIKYNIEDLKRLNKTFKISRRIPSIEKYIEYYPNITEIPLRREIVGVVNDDMIIVNNDLPSPDEISYLSYSFYLSKIDEYPSLAVNEEYVYCKGCHFLRYKSKGVLTVQSNNITEMRRVVKIYDDSLIRVDASYNISNYSNARLIYSHDNGYNMAYGNGFVKKDKENITGWNTSFLQSILPNDCIYFIKTNSEFTNEVIYVSIENNRSNQDVLCRVKNVLSDSSLVLDEYNDCHRKSFDAMNYLIIKYSNETLSASNQSIHLPKFFAPNSPYDLNTINEIILNNTISQSSSQLQAYNHIPLTESKITIVNFNLHTINHINVAYISLILSHSKLITTSDYEIIINSKSGILIKQIGNKKTLSFYTNEIRKFFVENTQCQLILFNSTIYFNSIDNDQSFSIKLKFPFDSSLPLKHLMINRPESNNIIMKDIRVLHTITKSQMLDIFIYEKKYFLADNVTMEDVYINGDYCESEKKNRTVIIEYKCDPTGINDLAITKVKEDKLCEYKYIASSKLICNPNILMKNVVKSAVNQLTCVPKDDNYNKDTKNFFDK